MPGGRQEVGPGTVHVGLWRLANGERRWALASPYDRKLVDGVKTIPGRARAWLPAARVWLFEREYLDTVRGLCGRIFWTEVLCSTCWSGETCAVLAELAGVAGAVHLTSKAPPAPSPPWPPEPPKTREEAAKLLGVHVDAEPAAIKKRFRQLSLEAHPDQAGAGSTARMRAIIAARDLLNSVHSR